MSTITPSTPRPSVIQLAIKEKAALYAAYIPIFTDGGVFIPTSREYKLGRWAGKESMIVPGKKKREQAQKRQAGE